MKKVGAKIFFVLFAFAFALSSQSSLFCFANYFGDGAETCSETIETAEEVESFEEEQGGEEDDSEAARFVSFANGSSWGDFSLAEDVDLSDSKYAISGSIGTEKTPFSSVFNGNGHTISNLTVSISISSDDTTAYLGLFGYASGATIQNVTFSNITINCTYSGTSAISLSNVFSGLIAYAKNSQISGVSISGSVTINFAVGALNYVGVLAGRVDDCSLINIQNISSSSAITFSPLSLSGATQANANGTTQTTLTGTSQIGLLVGRVDDSTLTQAIVRRGMSSLSFSTTTTSSTYIGGAVGGATNGSVLTFLAVEADISLATEQDFSGSVFVGGAVGMISGGFTSLQDVAISNTYSITDSANKVSIGEVGGYVSSVAPASGNIAYVHYASNGNDKFGEGTYTPENSATMDYVTYTTISLRVLTTTTNEKNEVVYPYFTSLTWAPMLGEWDLDTVFYVSGNSLFLQSFYGNFSVTAASSSTISASVESASLLYGQSIAMSFVFVDGCEDYYTPTSLLLGGEVVASIYKTGTGENATYTISSPDVFTIETIADSEKLEFGFKVTVNSVNLSTAGEYSISCNANSYVMSVTSAAYTLGSNIDTLEDVTSASDITVDTTQTPGYVYFSTSTTTTTKQISRTISIESTIPPLQTSVISGQAFAFSGFWLISYGEQIEIVQSSSFTFDLSKFNAAEVSTFAIYALYSTDAFALNFHIDDGLSAIYVGGKEVSEAGEGEDYLTIIIAKSSTIVTIEIVILKGYELDVATFLDYTDTFKGSISGGEEAQTNEDGTVSYLFTLNMQNLVGDSDSSQLNLTVSIEKSKTKIPAWVWWAIGGVVVGAAVIGLSIWLIVWLVSRKRGGFGGGFGKKRSFGKRGYY